MGKIYCTYCGAKNSSKEGACSQCKKKLNPKDPIWKEYFINHIKDDLKGKLEDKPFSILTNYIKSHLYGTIFTALIISGTAIGITSAISNNDDTLIVSEKPTIIAPSELSLEDDLVKRLYKINDVNSLRQIGTSFYEGKLIKYDDINEDARFALTYLYEDYKIHEKEVKTCDELKGYEDAYDYCLREEKYFLDGYTTFKLIDEKDFTDSYQRIFGSDKSINEKKYHFLAMAFEFNKDGDGILNYTLPEGWIDTIEDYTSPIKAIKRGNVIELYDYHIVLTNIADLYGTYKDSEFKEKLSDEIDVNLVTEGQIYKHTYKKDRNGNYYWYSSEPVDRVL